MRFNLPAYPTVHFSESIWVQCPNCQDMGLVRTHLSRYNIPFPTGYSTQFACKYCHYSKTHNEDWYGYYQGTSYQTCGFCGSGLSFISEPTKAPYEKVILSCDACKQTKPYPLKWYRYKEDKPIDPFFGLDLWMQTSIKSNTLWLYNQDHLAYLRAYVQAKLRADDQRHKYSMISNLPQWVKAAKNRDLIIRKLNQLEKELKNKIKPYQS